MVASQPPSPSWWNNQLAESVPKQLPCLDSSPQCIQQLTEAALIHSAKLQQLEAQIAILNQRLALTQEQIDYSEKKSWTSYITIDPIELIQNLFGGGQVQQDKIAIGQLNVNSASIEAAIAHLQQQVVDQKVLLEVQILGLVLEVEATARKQELLVGQLQTLEQQTAIVRVAYRHGRGSTDEILQLQDKRDRLMEQIVSTKIKQEQAVRELLQLTSAPAVTTSKSSDLGRNTV